MIESEFLVILVLALLGLDSVALPLERLLVWLVRPRSRS